MSPAAAADQIHAEVAPEFVPPATEWTIESCDAQVAAGVRLGWYHLSEMSNYCSDTVGLVPKLDTAFDEEIDAYAREFDVTQDEAQHRLEIMPTLAKVTGQVRIASASRLGHATITHSPFGVKVELTEGESVEIVESLLKNSKVPYTLTYNREFSQSDLIYAAQAITHDYGPTEPRFMLAYANEIKGLVEVVLKPGESTPSPLPLSDVPAELVVDDVQPADAGNRWIISTPSGDGGRCTSGLTLRTSGSGRDMSTAAHCGFGSLYYQWFSDPSTRRSMTFVTMAANPRADVQVRSITGTVNPYLYINTTSSSNTREMHSQVYRVDQMGLWICKFGRTTGPSCGTVSSINYAWSGVVATYFSTYSCATTPCDPVWVRSGMSQAGVSESCLGGDSGGALYIGNNAVGILSGCSGGGKTIYMAAGYVSEVSRAIFCSAGSGLPNGQCKTYAG